MHTNASKEISPQLNTPTGIKNSHEEADMPSHAVRVFDGELFNVYQWHQEMFDGSTQVFERLARKDGATIIAVTKDKKILITYEEQPNRDSFISLPHGGVDAGETPFEAAQRELREETGYIAGAWEEWFIKKGPDKISELYHTYIARNATATESVHADVGEKIHVEEVSFDDFCEIVLRDDFRTKTVSLKVATMLAQGKKEELRALLLG